MRKLDYEDTSTFPALGRSLLWLDKRQNIERIVIGLYIACAMLFLADFLYVKKANLSAESVPGFYALYGFFVCGALVIGAKAMRTVLKRPEGFYAPHDVETEAFPDSGLERKDHDG